MSAINIQKYPCMLYKEASNTRTITLTGKRGNHLLSISVDGGSTHSFLDKNTAAKLKCILVQTSPTKVLVFNGNHIISSVYVMDLSGR